MECGCLLVWYSGQAVSALAYKDTDFIDKILKADTINTKVYGKVLRGSKEPFCFRLIVFYYRQFVIIIICYHVLLPAVFEDKLLVGIDVRIKILDSFIGVRQRLLRACL